MPEKIRLVIWDLDETFWRGTLTEGGYTYVQSHHDIVVELAKRGIISSICSRNDHSVIEEILSERGLWNYFIFPSIDWTAKGPRLGNIVEATQLRAATVLFIDDNATNRAEALRFVPEIQVGDPSLIDGILADPRLQGKDDRQLTRLRQYKILEQRAREMRQTPDPRDFLRESEIRVIIDHDVEPNLDRAVELINRTNQLNFTKRRLSENIDQARTELLDLLRRNSSQAGLIRVVDRYGDYGYVGFYLRWIDASIDGGSALLHYCFSCRTLGMQVETWLYQRMGRPAIKITGDVVTDILDPSSIVDWIRMDTGGTSEMLPANELSNVSRIVLRGGCEMAAVAHYFELLTRNVVLETTFNRDGLPIRLDHSQMLRQALNGLSNSQFECVRRVGFEPDDFKTALSESVEGPEVWLLAFWSDRIPHFRHPRFEFPGSDSSQSSSWRSMGFDKIQS